MRRFLATMTVLGVLPLAGCQYSGSGSVVYGPPCGYRAVDSGMCQYVGDRKPINI